MTNKLSYFKKLYLPLNLRWSQKVGIIAVFLSLICATPALAHHPLGGRVPANLFEGILSGFGHPILGFDHLAFVIASGLLAVGISRGLLIPIAFVIATAIGAVIHLQAIDLPIPEIVIATSVILSGILLVIRQNQKPGSLIIAGLAALAGIFHGHAYGEGIFGAESTPLIAYLIGFTVIQLAISWGIYFLGSRAIKIIRVEYITRFAGFAIAASGLVFLSSAITG